MKNAVAYNALFAVLCVSHAIINQYVYVDVTFAAYFNQNPNNNSPKTIKR